MIDVNNFLYNLKICTRIILDENKKPCGSLFLLQGENTTFYISAKHVFEDKIYKEKTYLFQKSDWSALPTIGTKSESMVGNFFNWEEFSNFQFGNCDLIILFKEGVKESGFLPRNLTTPLIGDNIVCCGPSYNLSNISTNKMLIFPFVLGTTTTTANGICKASLDIISEYFNYHTNYINAGISVKIDIYQSDLKGISGSPMFNRENSKICGVQSKIIINEVGNRFIEFVDIGVVIKYLAMNFSNEFSTAYMKELI